MKAKKIEGDLRDHLKRQSDTLKTEYEHHSLLLNDALYTDFEAFARQQLRFEEQLLGVFEKAMGSTL